MEKEFKDMVADEIRRTIWKHVDWMTLAGACPACDFGKGQCDAPVRVGGVDLFMKPSVGDLNELRSLDAIHGGLPDWFPYEGRKGE